MSGFLYFIPNKDEIAVAEIRNLPMAYAFEKRESISQVLLGAGPASASGVLFASKQRVPVTRLKYDASKQTWIEWEGFHVGFWNESRPTPDELIRSETLPGKYIELGDGNDWMIPVARRWSINEDSHAMEWETSFPRNLELRGKDRVHNGSVIEKYRQLWVIANAVFNVRHDGETASEYISTDAERELMGDGSRQVLCAVQAIQANYCVGPAECLNLLGLFHSETMLRIYDVLCDWQNYLDVVQKKRELALAGQHS